MKSGESIITHGNPQRTLLVMDVEGTIFKSAIKLPGVSLSSTVWQSLAKALGHDAVLGEIQTHSNWAEGFYASYMDWMKDTIRIHQRNGLTLDLFRRIIARAEYNPGIVRFFESLDRNCYEVVLISGGFRELAARAQKRFGIRHAFAACEYLFDSRGKLEGYNLLPCDFEGKYDFIKLMLREYRLKGDAWMFVGDGLNDVPIAKRAPLSIAYQAHDDLKRVSTYTVESYEQLSLLIQTLAGPGRNKRQPKIRNRNVIRRLANRSIKRRKY
jgi:phosphoserine phosphatase